MNAALPLTPERIVRLNSHSQTFAPTEPTSTPQSLLDALRSGDREALNRGWRLRNRRHPLQPL